MAVSLSFTNKKVLITGAARGLGRDLVKVFHEQDAIIYALARNPENLAKLKTDFPKVHTIVADLSNWEETRVAVEKIGPVDCLVNNAAIAGVCPFLDIKPEDFDAMMNTNVKSVINVSQVVARGMMEQGKGSIVNVSSMGSKLYSKNISLYCTTKTALDMLTKSMAVELGKFGIRTNSVNPTIFYTDMSKQYLDRFPDGGGEYQARVGLKRIVQSSEIVNTILFLLSDAAPMINGETILIDGAFTCS